MLKEKQQALKPFDFVLSVKIAVHRDRAFLLADLASEFDVSLSTVHAALIRAELARLLSRSAGSLRAVRPALQEFAIHGLKYAFPATIGRASRGVPTAAGAPVLANRFEGAEQLLPVWPHPDGNTYGFEVTPLHPSVPRVALRDDKVYDVLALVDALRIGAAREREAAMAELRARL